MIKHLVFAAVISTLALSGQPHPGDNSASSTTTSQSQGDRHRLEDEKLRLEVESLRGQATTAERIKDWGAFAQSVATILSFIVGMVGLRKIRARSGEVSKYRILCQHQCHRTARWFAHR